MPADTYLVTDTSHTQSSTFAKVLACFALSGFAGLLYQTVWTREFAFVFGTSELAVAVVLAGYMGGLALGAIVAARWIDQVRRPLLTYGLLELGIAVSALAVPVAIRAVLALSVTWFGGLPEPPSADAPLLGLFQLLATLAILLVPTALMGATLPLLARYCVHTDRQVGTRTGLLYAINTLGAVAGTLVAAFVLLPELGLRQTVWVGVAANALVFVLAAAISRSQPFDSASAGLSEHKNSQPAETTASSQPKQNRAALILVLALIGGSLSFVYEVMWTRLLGQMLGGTVYAFATMLASFLIGIALGSAAAAPLARSRRAAVIGFAVAELGVALAARAAFVGIDYLPDLALSMGGGAAFLPARDAMMSALVLLPSTFFLGATFPFAVRILVDEPRDAAAGSARVYAWNTIGGVVGALLGGLWLLPNLGFAATMQAASILNAALAVAACLILTPTPRTLIAVCLAATLGLAAAPIDEPWRVLRVMALGGNVVDDNLAFFRVGRSSTVALTVGGDGWGLRTNGLPESTIQRIERQDGLRSARLLSVLPVLVQPQAKSMLVVGLGGGVVVETVPTSVTEIDVVELEPAVVEANAFVASRRVTDPLADPRIHIHTNDVRGALALTTKKWDIIVSQPSHPWTPGASHLYTHEFAVAARDHLNPGGVFVQWIGTPFVDTELFKGLVGSIYDAFPKVGVYNTGDGSMLILGSDRSPVVGPEAAAVVANDPQSFARAGVLGAEDGWLIAVIDAAEVGTFVGDATRSTDEFNLMLTRSPRILRSPASGNVLKEAYAPYDPMFGGLAGPDNASSPKGFDLVFTARRLIATGKTDRVKRLADNMDDPIEALIVRGYLELARGDQRWAQESFRAALLREPKSHKAAAALYLSRTVTSAPPSPLVLAGLSTNGRAVVEAQRDDAAGNFAALSHVDDKLAAITAQDPLFSLACRLRAGWRVESGELPQAREAFDILRRALLVREERAANFLLRARAAWILGLSEQAESDLKAGLKFGQRDGLPPRDLAKARDLLDRLPIAPEGKVRNSILELIRRIKSPLLSAERS